VAERGAVIADASVVEAGPDAGSAPVVEIADAAQITNPDA
jgi:hypothetical protein